MVYTKRSPAPLILGIIFLLIAVTLQMGLQEGLVEYLNIGKTTAEMTGDGREIHPRCTWS